MLECLISFIIFAIVLLIVLYIIEAVLTQFFPLPPKVVVLIRLLVGLLLLIQALGCLGVLPHGPFFRGY